MYFAGFLVTGDIKFHSIYKPRKMGKTANRKSVLWEEIVANLQWNEASLVWISIRLIPAARHFTFYSCRAILAGSFTVLGYAGSWCYHWRWAWLNEFCQSQVSLICLAVIGYFLSLIRELWGIFRYLLCLPTAKVRIALSKHEFWTPLLWSVIYIIYQWISIIHYNYG